MNEVNDASAKWEDLLRRILDFGDKFQGFYLPDSDSDWYAFSNELLMREMSERLLEALQTAWRNPSIYHNVRFGNKFFASMSELQQWSFLRRIMALPVRAVGVGDATNYGAQKPAITICTLSLLDALADLNYFLCELRLENFALRNQSDVEALSNIILAKRNTLREIRLGGIECPINYNKQDEDGPVVFLDSLVYAASRSEKLHEYELSARTPPTHSSLVSPEAVRALLDKGGRWNHLRMNGLGFNDRHFHAIAEALRVDYTSVGELNLRSNPAISAQGYGALLHLINQGTDISRCFLDDKCCEAELNLVITMNRYHNRLDYMTDGTFSSVTQWVQWLEKLANLPSMRVGDAEAVNYIWYTLRENPEFFRTISSRR